MLNYKTALSALDFDKRHGGPFDRGSADSWYSRPVNPHYFKGATLTTPIVTVENMTEEEIAAYIAGYEYNEEFGGKKSWD